MVVAEAVADEREAAWIERHLRPLLGLTADVESRGGRDESFSAWRRFFEALAERSPLVLVFEDLHWADEGLLDFVDYLVDWASGVPLLVVALARPELLSRRQGWGGGRPNAVTLSLSPLSDEETARLVHSMLDRRLMLQTALVERAGGNPLYAEEFARIAGERGTSGGGDLPLPDTVQGLIAARLDSLGGNEKRLLQDAAVVGREFWLGAVLALTGGGDEHELQDRLHALERREFLRRERRSVVDEDTQYVFFHALVRDVAYAQIPRPERAEKHERAAVWIESLGRSEDHAEMRAYHYVNALEAAEAAGADTSDLTESARRALRDAGERASALSAFAAAVQHYDRALRLTPDDHDDRAELLFLAARARFAATRGSTDELAVARDALLAKGDIAGAAEAETLAARVAWTEARGDDVLVHLERAERLAEPLPLSAAKVDGYTILARLHWLGNREEAARRLADRALEMADELDVDAIRAPLLSMLGTARATAGDLGGLDALEESIAIFEQLGSGEVSTPYNNLADTLFRLGRLDEARETTDRMTAAQKRFPGSIEWTRWNDSQVLRLQYTEGRWDQALELVEHELAGLEAGARHYLEPEWRTFRARIRFARGDRAEAGEDTAIAVDRSRESGDAQLTIPSLALHARVLCPNHRSEAQEAADELVDVCRRSPPHVASDWFTEAALALAALDRAGDVDAIAETAPVRTPWLDAGLALGHGSPDRAAEILGAMGALPWEAEARLVAARSGAVAGLDEAMAFFRSVNATAFLREAEALFAETRTA